MVRILRKRMILDDSRQPTTDRAWSGSTVRWLDDEAERRRQDEQHCQYQRCGGGRRIIRKRIGGVS